MNGNVNTNHINPSDAYSRQRMTHWEAVASHYDSSRSWGRFYHRRIQEIYRFLVSPGQRVLEVGCGEGDLLAALQPALGIGIDFSPRMVAQARQRHPELTFYEMDAHQIQVEGPFDVIILSDLVNDVWDVQTVLQQVARLCTHRTRVLLNFYSRLWEAPLSIAQKVGMAQPNLPQNWLTVEDLNNLLYLSGFETLRHWSEILWPLPLLNVPLNHWLAKLWPFTYLDLTNFLIARLRPAEAMAQPPLVSVIVPARNEAGNIASIFQRVPEMGAGTELIFVEGHSQDNTYTVILEQISIHPQRKCALYKQEGKGKGDAVRKGFAKASGDVLMILDADLTVSPEDLPRFYEALISRKGDVINGVRLVYPMEKEAMRFFNLFGNKSFSLAFSWLLGQPIKDTLCGTKVLWKTDYDRIAGNRAHFGDFDPFGDYDLLFGASHLNLKITDLPIRYQARSYGTTNISRWKHGWLLFKMVLFAARRIKFT